MSSLSVLKLLRYSTKTKPTNKPEQSRQKHSFNQRTAGFTLIELLVVVIIIGVLAAIMGPGWITFINQRRANAVNDAVLSALQEAQSQAKKTKLSYSVSFRTPTGKVPEIAVYPTKKADGTTVDPDRDIPNSWKSVNEELGIQPGQVVLQANIRAANEATTSASETGTITFDYLGTLPPQDPTPNLAAKGLIVRTAVANGTNPPVAVASTQRCVKIMTLLGGLQIGKREQCNF